MVFNDDEFDPESVVVVLNNQLSIDGVCYKDSSQTLHLLQN